MLTWLVSLYTRYFIGVLVIGIIALVVLSRVQAIRERREVTRSRPPLGATPATAQLHFIEVLNGCSSHRCM